MVKSLRALGGILLIAPSMAVIPLTANAAAPVFDSFTNDNGLIVVNCPAGFTCETLTFTNDGFAQTQWVDQAGGITYIHTVIDDQAGGYRDESFVRLGSDNGIMSRQTHTENNPSLGLFQNTSSMNIGWANPNPNADNPTMEIVQLLQNDAEGFTSRFDMLLINDGAGDVQDRSITIDQRAALSQEAGDVQAFVLEGRAGAFTSAGSITLAPTTFDGDNNPLNGGTVSWTDGQDVMVRWIGQSIDLDAQGLSVFGFQGVLNNDTGDEATTFSTTSTGIIPDNGGYLPPFDWDATFGATAPTLP